MGCRSSRALAVEATSEPKDVNPSSQLPTDSFGQVLCNERHGSDVLQGYEIGNLLGSSSGNVVREAWLVGAPRREVRAIKVVRKTGSANDAWSHEAILRREAIHLRECFHDNIVRFHDFFETTDCLYLVIGMCKGCDLFRLLERHGRLSEQHTVYFGRQMLQAISYLHSVNIVHRDIKAENFACSEPTVTAPLKMMNFGMACKFEEGTRLTQLLGSAQYMAPEMVLQSYGCSVDVWACGILLYVLLYGSYPHDGHHSREIMFKVVEEPIVFPSRKNVLSKRGLSFMQAALQPLPADRPSAQNLLRSSWMKHGKTCFVRPGWSLDHGQARRPSSMTERLLERISEGSESSSSLRRVRSLTLSSERMSEGSVGSSSSIRRVRSLTLSSSDGKRTMSPFSDGDTASPELQCNTHALLVKSKSLPGGPRWLQEVVAGVLAPASSEGGAAAATAPTRPKPERESSTLKTWPSQTDNGTSEATLRSTLATLARQRHKRDEDCFTAVTATSIGTELIPGCLPDA